MLEIASKAYGLGLEPEEGAGVTYLRFEGVDVLRPAVPSRAGPLGLSSFPLVPFANRIAHGRFVWCGQPVDLEPNLYGHPHPLHGDGWLTPWALTRAGSDFAELETRREAGEWPWAYSARQTIRADDQGVSFELELSNLGDRPMPAGLGFHPYFPDRSSGRLRASVGGVWLTDEEGLPTNQAPADRFGDWAHCAPMQSSVLVDHCHAGWSGPADIALPDRGLKVRMTASPSLGFLHIYSPPGEDFFCVEPVSHRPDALNAPDPAAEGVVALGPGGRLKATMRLEAAPL